MRAALDSIDGFHPGNLPLFWNKQKRMLELAIWIRENETRPFRCLAGYIDAVVYPNGELAFCEMARPFAKLSAGGDDFLDIWTSGRQTPRNGSVRPCRRVLAVTRVTSRHPCLSRPPSCTG